MKTLLAAIAISFIAGAASAAFFNGKQTATAAPAATIVAETQAWKIAPSAVMDAGRCAEIVGGEQNCR